MCHELVALLGCRIKAYRIVYLILFLIRNLLVQAIDRTAGGKDQMRHLKIAAAFQQHQKTLQVAFQISIRIYN